MTSSSVVLKCQQREVGMILNQKHTSILAVLKIEVVNPRAMLKVFSNIEISNSKLRSKKEIEFMCKE